MGLSIWSSHRGCDCGDEGRRPPNPDPKNFEIWRYEENGDWLLVVIRYPDCINFNGDKILLYRNITIERLKGLTEIDPHFSNKFKQITPFARFVPTEEGWNTAVKLMDVLAKEGTVK